MVNKTFCVSLRLPELFCYSPQIYPGAPARSEPKKFNYAGSRAGRAEASHLIFAQSRIQHPPHPHRCLSSVSILWMNMHYSTLIRPACSCEQRRDEDSTRTLAPGSYKTPEKVKRAKKRDRHAIHL